jgi:guanylate kinase
MSSKLDKLKEFCDYDRMGPGEAAMFDKFLTAAIDEAVIHFDMKERIDALEERWKAANGRQSEAISRLMDQRQKALQILGSYDQTKTAPWNMIKQVQEVLNGGS